MGLLIAIFEAIPVLQGWLHSFLEAYAEWEKTQAKANLKIALENAIAKYDQRDLESEQISGVPTNKPGMSTRNR